MFAGTTDVVVSTLSEDEHDKDGRVRVTVCEQKHKEDVHADCDTVWYKVDGVTVTV